MTEAETMKEQIEYYARKGMNPYTFSNQLIGAVTRDEELNKIFTDLNNPMTKKLSRVIDESVFRTFDTQDKHNEGDTWSYLRARLKPNNDSFKTKKNKGKVTDQNKNQKTPWNIYQTKNTETLGDRKNRWEFIHTLLKYKIVIPLIWIGRKFFWKKLKLDIPNTPYNENLLLFDAAYEDTIRDWNHLYLRGLPNPYTAGKSDEWWDEHIQKDAVNKNMRFIKDGILAVVQTDTAYREFLNLLVHNIGRHGSMHYARVKEAGNGVIRHPFYSSGFAEDVHYLHYYRLLRDRTKTRLVESGKVEIQDTSKKLPDEKKDESDI